jgi:hypothetical protein
MSAISPDHPRQTFLFALDEDYTLEDETGMKALVAEIAASRTWVLGPPDYVDQSETTEWDEADDKPIRTVGGAFELYSGHPPWGDKLPREIDRRHFDEVEAVVNALVEFTRLRQIEVTLELDGKWVGQIVKGVPDDLVTDTLLGEWRRSLAD